jgi:ParB/Sulfiredoxin domain
LCRQAPATPFNPPQAFHGGDHAEKCNNGSARKETRTMDDQSGIPGPPTIGKPMTVPVEQIVVARSRLDENKIAELRESILAVGLLQPIVVVALKVEDGAEPYN